MSPSASEGNRDELKTEDLGVKEPTSSAKKRDQAAEGFLAGENYAKEIEQVQPFEFSEDSKDSDKENSEVGNESAEEEMKNNYQHLYDQFQADISGISRSKSEDWGGAGYRDYQNSEDAILPMKLHYTEGDLSNIELVEEESEGEESEESHETPRSGDIDNAFSDRIQIAE